MSSRRLRQTPPDFPPLPRRWFAKKRYAIPLGLLGFLVVVGVLSPAPKTMPSTLRESADPLTVTAAPTTISTPTADSTPTVESSPTVDQAAIDASAQAQAAADALAASASAQAQAAADASAKNAADAAAAAAARAQADAAPMKAQVAAAAQAKAAAAAANAAPTPAGPIDYANCLALNAVYPHGVGMPGAVDHVASGRPGVTTFTRNAALYQAYSSHDGDGDMIACERK